jgi:tetratricopeptide (TPR) repeat protein
MYNVLLSVGAGVAVAAIAWALFGPWAAIVPALLVSVLAMFLLARRTSAQVEADVKRVLPLLQERRIDEAETLLVGVKTRYARWQFLLAGQIDAQLGMIDYLQMKFDEARPKLESGRWRNWSALLALGAIAWRQGRKDEAWKAFQAAADAGSKESLVYCIWATLLTRDGLRKEALEAVGKGLAQQPTSQLLKDLHAKIANDRKIDPKAFGEGWYQYFPEDLARDMVMRGRRGAGPVPQQAQPQPKFGARHAPRR